MERDMVVEYKERNESDDEFDEVYSPPFDVYPYFFCHHSLY